MTSHLISCPPAVGADICASREGRGDIPGLGKDIAESYLYPIQQHPPGCQDNTFRILRYTVLVTVEGKGALSLGVPPSNENCLLSALNPTYPPGTVEGGSGVYAGASGTVSLEQHAHYTLDGGSAGTDAWVGTLAVAGVEFDVTPPTLSGAVNKKARVRKRSKRVRVTYHVTARDDVDGVVPALCRPASGTRFRVGRTVVRCSATDKSANTKRERFTIAVRVRR